MEQDGLVLSCGGSGGPTCLALSHQDVDAELEKNSTDGGPVNGAKGVTQRKVYSSCKNAFVGFPQQWQHHSQMDYSRYYATGFEGKDVKEKKFYL